MSSNRTFMVEAYAPAESELVALLEQAHAAASVDGGPQVLHVRSILVPEDETCFHLFEAESLDAVSTAVNAAAIHANRIVEVAT